MLITLVNGENRRIFSVQRNADDTEVTLTRVRDPTERSSSTSAQRDRAKEYLHPMLIAAENEASRLVERLERGIRRIVNSSGHGQQHRQHQQQQPQEPAFQCAHTKVAADPRRHYTIVPSWAVRGEDKRGPCNICLEQDTHLQIKCTRCNNQCVCCKCVVGVYCFINPCPMCRHRGER